MEKQNKFKQKAKKDWAYLNEEKAKLGAMLLDYPAIEQKISGKNKEIYDKALDDKKKLDALRTQQGQVVSSQNHLMGLKHNISQLKHEMEQEEKKTASVPAAVGDKLYAYEKNNQTLASFSSYFEDIKKCENSRSETSKDSMDKKNTMKEGKFSEKISSAFGLLGTMNEERKLNKELVAAHDKLGKAVLESKHLATIKKSLKDPELVTLINNYKASEAKVASLLSEKKSKETEFDELKKTTEEPFLGFASKQQKKINSSVSSLMKEYKTLVTELGEKFTAQPFVENVSKEVTQMRELILSQQKDLEKDKQYFVDIKNTAVTGHEEREISRKQAAKKKYASYIAAYQGKMDKLDTEIADLHQKLKKTGKS